MTTCFLVDDSKMSTLIGLGFIIGYAFFLVIEYLVRLDKPRPTGEEAKKHKSGIIAARRVGMFVLLFGIIMPLTFGILRRTEIAVYHDGEPGTVKRTKYMASDNVTEVEGVPIEMSGSGGYYIVNKTSYPITLTEVFYDNGVLISDSTRVLTLERGQVVVVDIAPRFRNRAAPDTYYHNSGRNKHPANGYYYSLQIPGVNIMS